MKKYTLVKTRFPLQKGRLTPIIIPMLGHKKVFIGDTVEVPEEILEGFIAKYESNFKPAGSKEAKAAEDFAKKHIRNAEKPGKQNKMATSAVTKKDDPLA